MSHMLFIQMMGLLGLRLRYWVIIIVVILVLLALGFFARGGRSA
ncbi:MAG: hypothetical protein ACR2JC_04005 [Chloroflexota bacterium]